ncbi:LOW QUALITY PROTEIN: SCY1-like protein 2 [Paramacrobiotus metropolitanus]|uniref:LOW QUALITY PROTEIN: SCY1-like protein 2 n=1 Tax=Paramacrobiotus metropolitanus TaxID=2943436 RepID=UPI002445B80F|nr:LOW QUALITY PROTEIN: SCY1-like protein 2 [Paramacrobiotus metropolitanus]
MVGRIGMRKSSVISGMQPTPPRDGSVGSPRGALTFRGSRGDISGTLGLDTALNCLVQCPALAHGVEAGEFIGTFGPECVWRIYDVTRRSDKEALSVFIFEKRIAEKLHKPKRKGTITELYKRGCSHLERMQHIRFLKLMQATEETADALLFVSEAVVGSLFDVISKDRGRKIFGQPDNLLECPLLDLEIKCGIAQITEALIHLHSTEHCMHGNVCPETILVLANGSWKLAGLEFAEKSPNRVLGVRLREFMVQMPNYLQEAVENLLHRDPRHRPTAQLFSMAKYFNDPALTCLRRLDYLDQMFPSQKAEFYPALRDALHSVPRKLWQTRVLPALSRDLANQDLGMAPYAIYPLSYMIEHSDKLDYQELYKPSVQYIFDCPDKPIETQIILLRNLSSFAKLATPEEVRSELIPVLDGALQSVNSDVLEAGVQCFARFYPIIRDDTIKVELFQTLKTLFRKGTDYSVKVQPVIISSLDKILDHLTKSFVLDEMLPVLADERLTYSVDSINALVDLYRHIFKDSRFSLSPEQLTKYILPALIPFLTHPDLSKEQYLNMDAFLKEALSLVDKRQRTRYKLDVSPSTPSPSAFASTGRLLSDGREYSTTSANNSRRGSMTGEGLKVMNGMAGLGGPHIVFTTGDGSNASSRSSSPTHSSRRSSYQQSISRDRSSSVYLNVEETSASRSRTSPTSPERRGSFLGLQGFPAGLNANQRRHSAVSIQAISSHMVSLFAGRT